jgi:hypothetical protein
VVILCSVADIQYNRVPAEKRGLRSVPNGPLTGSKTSSKEVEQALKHEMQRISFPPGWKTHGKGLKKCDEVKGCYNLQNVEP